MTQMCPQNLTNYNISLKILLFFSLQLIQNVIERQLLQDESCHYLRHQHSARFIAERGAPAVRWLICRVQAQIMRRKHQERSNIKRLMFRVAHGECGGFLAQNLYQ